MNHFAYDDLYVGQTESFTRIITEKMMDGFRAVSGDDNSLHADKEYAVSVGFPGRVVYGMCTASLYSCLGGVYLPGEHCLLHSVHADFLSPVFIGDTLTVEGKIAEKHDSVKQIIIKAVIRNQNGKKVSRAVIEAGVRK